MSQLEKHLPYNCEDQSWVPLHPHKCLQVWEPACNLGSDTEIEMGFLEQAGWLD